MANLIAYCRVSSDGQRDNTSLGTQRDSIDQFCKLNNHKIVGIFHDVESAATIEARENLHYAMEALAAADGLIVYRLDRLTRSVFDAERLKRSFMKQNKLLISVLDQTNIETEEGEFLYIINTAVAQLERKRILSRASAGMRKKKELGKYYGGAAPYGWAPYQGTLVELPHEQSVIKMIRQMYWNDSWSLTAIAKHLNALGIPTKRRCQWRRDIVKRIVDGDTLLIDKLKESGELLPPEVWEEHAYGKKRNSS